MNVTNAIGSSSVQTRLARVGNGSTSTTVIGRYDTFFRYTSMAQKGHEGELCARGEIMRSRGGRSRAYSQAARAGYFRGVRVVEESGRVVRRRNQIARLPHMSMPSRIRPGSG